MTSDSAIPPALELAAAQQQLCEVDRLVQEEFVKRINAAGIWTQITPEQFGYSWWNVIYILRDKLADDHIVFKVQIGQGEEKTAFYTQRLQIEQRQPPVFRLKVEALCQEWPEHAEAIRAGRIPLHVVPLRPQVWMHVEFKKTQIDGPRNGWSVHLVEPKVQLPPVNDRRALIKETIDEVFTYLSQRYPQLAGKHVLQPWQLLPPRHQQRDASPTRPQ